MKQSTWKEYREIGPFPKLVKPAKTDIAIVGGGMAGLLSAYLLSKEGRKVTIIEKGKVADGATVLTTAFLTNSLDTDYADLISMYGLKNAKAIIRAHQQAIDLIETIAMDENIKCEFTRDSNFIYANSKRDAKGFKEEINAMKKLDVNAALESGGEGLGFKNAGYIEIKNQAKFNPLMLASALVKVLRKRGVKIYENTEAAYVTASKVSASIETKSGMIFADWAIVATYEPFNKPLRLYFKKGFYVSYVYEADLQNIEILEGTYEDTHNPYHYFRIDVRGTGSKKKRRMIIGGEDHREDLHVSERKSFNALLEYLDDLIGPENYKITKEWRGPILEPVDGLAYIGKLNNERILYAMAFSGNGMTYSAISATIFADIIAARKNPLEKIFSPKRIPNFQSMITKGKDYGEELVKGGLKNTITQSKKRKAGSLSKRPV